MSAMSADAELAALDRKKHRNCDRWGHCKPTAEEKRETHIWLELAIWLLISASALATLAMFGGVRP